MKSKNIRKHWIHLGLRVFRLYFTQKEKTSDLVRKGYTSISRNYDRGWTNHMRHLTDDMLKKLDPPKYSKCIDLSCGTGYVTGRLADITDSNVIGVDLSNGMLNIAKKKYSKSCRFIQSDILEYLKNQSDNSYDIVTCAWALCYSEPYEVIKEIKRILRNNGKVGIIDNAFSTIYELFFAGIYTVAEDPNMLKHIFKIHPMGNKYSLYLKLKMNGFKILDFWNGEKRMYVESGKDVIKKLMETGTSSGYQYFIYDNYYNQVLKRYPLNVEKLYKSSKGIPIIYRFIASIAQKK
jgi:ubiquinone/menaquinone biosynthesis C-methylase UbiE